MDAAPPLELRALKDETLESAIAEQQRLIASNPDMEQYLGAALRQHLAERERRAREPPAPAPATPLPPDEDHEDDEQYSYESPVLAPSKAERTASAERRVRFMPSRYAEESSGIVKRPPTREERAHAEANQTMREQMRQNEESIRKSAMEFSCPLLRAAKQAEGVEPNDSMAYLLQTQMKQVAVASDGYQYDFAALRAHIKKGLSLPGGPLSPITKRSISVEVRYAPKKRDQKTGQVVPNAWVTKVWRPDKDNSASRATRA